MCARVALSAQASLACLHLGSFVAFLADTMPTFEDHKELLRQAMVEDAERKVEWMAAKAKVAAQRAAMEKAAKLEALQTLAGPSGQADGSSSESSSSPSPDMVIRGRGGDTHYCEIACPRGAYALLF